MQLQKLLPLTILFAFAASCSEPTQSGDEKPDAGDEDDVGQDDDSTGLLMDDDISAPECEPKTCDDLGVDCGAVADGCGDITECGECDDGDLCGIVSANVCTDPTDLATPLSDEEACEGRECGPAGDGRGGIVECGECEGDEVCGLNGPAQCGRPSESDEDNCPAKISSCEEFGAACGVIGNGCGGTIDCDEELGGCEDAELCGLGGSFTCGEAPDCEPIDPEAACEGKCGFVSNGCGADVDDGVIDCTAIVGHTCETGTVCGGGGTPNECSAGTCEVLSQAVACGDRECGAVTDGCDGTQTCGSCDAGELCLGGFCELACEPIPRLQACSGKDCGLVGDGCGGTYDCGACAADETCGLTEPHMCDPTPPLICVPFTEAEACAGRQCGVVFDGCGAAPENEIDCGAVGPGCAAGEICGVAQPFQCDVPTPPACSPATSCAELGWECGTAVDNCGNVFDCALEDLVCNSQTETCIGGIEGPTRCLNGTEGEGTCELCDAIPDCSGQAQVTTLTGRVITPGADDTDTANQLGVPNAFVYVLRNDDESELPAIDSGIPSDGVGGFGTACDRCEDQDLGPVLVSTTTNAFGDFSLEGEVPVGEDFVLVVKIGKWRRAVRIPALAPASACATTAIEQLQTRLPRNMADGLRANIPRVAVSTGSVDAMECVFHKLGVDSAEFVQPGAAGDAAGRIHMYRSENSGGARLSTGFTNAAALHTDTSRLFSYDMVVFDCEGGAFDHDLDDPRVREYVNRGGRMFASHWTYTWIFDNGTTPYSAATAFDTGLAPSAVWGTGDEQTDVGWVSVGRPHAVPGKIQNFADWLEREGAATVDAQGRYAIDIFEPRDLATRVGPASEEFVYRMPDASGGTLSQCKTCTSIVVEDNCVSSPSCAWDENAGTCGFANNCALKSEAECGTDPGCNWNGANCVFAQGCTGLSFNSQLACTSRPQCGWDATSVQQYAFNAPYGAPGDAICGRVAYSGFHIAAGVSGFGNAVFPAHCAGDLTSQEKVLAYMVFDLGSCVSPGGITPPNCAALTQADCSGRCGNIADGCGGVVDCQQCPAGQICLPGGVCATPECEPTTCEAEGKDCDLISDGCGGVLDCGQCPEGAVCGLLSPNVCSFPCEPLSSGTACEGKCGFLSDECSDVLDCGACPPELTCVDNECVDRNCDPATSCPSGLDCGLISDGCDGNLDCGDCELPEVCGGAGESNQCGLPECPALDCDALGAECGLLGNGCGSTVDCGVCPPGQLCGIEGPNQCDGCEPLSCSDVDAECGLIGDGCDATVDCGVCPEGQTCGANEPNKCGDGPSCPKRTCTQSNAECGVIGDGCGGTVDCGDCDAGQVCGIEEAFQCDDAPTCEPRTCEDADAQCGLLGDNCGALLDCGDCPVGSRCGIGNKCSREAK